MPTTIAAISTPLGMDDIGVIRLSGINAKIICDKIFVPLEKNFYKKSSFKKKV